MHLLWENVVKNLMLLWTGDYKQLDEGSEEYQIESKVWEAIGESSAASGSTIPYAFGPRPPNVASDKTSWTADSRSFWTLYLGPSLLQGRFKQRKYYDHFVKLVKLLNLCLQFEITKHEVEEVRAGFIEWVKEYERIYYQYDPQRLSACPLTIHALLHIADSIIAAGPVWASWAYPMERYCGLLQPAIRSRRFAYASIDRYVVDHARLQHIKLLYNMQQELSLKAPPKSSVGTKVPGYEEYALLPPSSCHQAVKMNAMDKAVFDRVVGALCTRFNSTPTQVKEVLGATKWQEWGKVQILGGGDLIRTVKCDKKAEDSRDASCIRYELLVDRNARYRNRQTILEKQTFFGRLQHIFHLQLPYEPATMRPRGSSITNGPIHIILAVIRSLPVTEKHPSLDVHYFTSEGALEAVDLSTVSCLVGCFKVDKTSHKWALIDRSGQLARAVYVGDEGDM
ncbi:hypothetical protein BXZ70DRAFT_897296 [Cristinia sonorae]|uniref:Uncharacterized protein n=1 Tax=Cristinia sonorae TaxID=1940300 RepID=A0A8K0UIE8_9AGAR|nr:hypothetical protein BXZ70DRAFT_897296 [Cristinia sonorae]